MATLIDMKTRKEKVREGNEILRFSHIVRTETKHVSINDQRRRVFYVLAAFLDRDGFEYRKSFESYDNPTVPSQGTHRELNGVQTQW